MRQAFAPSETEFYCRPEAHSGCPPFVFLCFQLNSQPAIVEPNCARARAELSAAQGEMGFTSAGHLGADGIRGGAEGMQTRLGDSTVG